LLGNAHTTLNLNALLQWSAQRQLPLEGGFNGRPNKLVDGCYSFWVGGGFILLDAAYAQKKLFEQGVQSTEKKPEVTGMEEINGFHDDAPGTASFNREALQEYILVCCQASSGGLLDKPSK
jgi:protein farnesyltransferase subunit beta